MELAFKREEKIENNRSANSIEFISSLKIAGWILSDFIKYFMTIDAWKPSKNQPQFRCRFVW